jgi:serine/threonine protein kinase
MQSFSTVNPYPQPGEVLDGKYRVERMLGEGGMGAVAKATHLLRRAPVALKFMSGAVLSLQGAVERFVNEGVAASQIDSDHVVKIFDVGRLPSGAPYLVMEYLEGCDLGQLIARDGPFIAPTRAVHFTLQALRALQTAHAAGIVHRDMKPSNCFVIQKDGEPDFIKLVDFGISKVRAAEDGQAVQLTRTNSALGTPLYMSPEQARSPRDVDHRTDLYSVGAILYEMLAGRTPYTAESGEYTEILFKIFTTEPEPLRNLRPDVPDGLAAVVQRALVRDPDGRFGSAADMAEALAPFADDRSSQVIGRLRGGRVRSLMPAGQRAVTPSAPAASATPELATAQTFASGGADALRGPIVPTDVGVTREAAGAGRSTGHKRGRAGIVIAVIAIGALSAASGVVAVRGRSSRVVDVKHEPAVPVSAVQLSSAAGPTSVTLLPLPTPSSSVAPLASASASASPEGLPRAAPRPSASSPNQSLPRQLGDLKLH